MGFGFVELFELVEVTLGSELGDVWRVHRAPQSREGSRRDRWAKGERRLGSTNQGYVILIRIPVFSAFCAVGS